jgi:hypothetical protein
MSNEDSMTTATGRTPLAAHLGREGGVSVGLVVLG